MVVANRNVFLDTLREIRLPLALIFAFQVLVTAAYYGLGWEWLALDSSAKVTLLGAGLTVFLGLRNNTAYGRWWESRKLWGQVVNDSRQLHALPFRFLMLPPESEALRRELTRTQVAWVHALRHFLRKQEQADIAPFLGAEALARVRASSNPPFAVQREIAVELVEARRRGWINDIEVAGVEHAAHQPDRRPGRPGGVSAIRRCPTSTTRSLRVFVIVYALVLPSGIPDGLRAGDPAGRPGDRLRVPGLRPGRPAPGGPFRRCHLRHPDELDHTHTIEINLREAIGETDSAGQDRPGRRCHPLSLVARVEAYLAMMPANIVRCARGASETTAPGR